MQTVIDNDERTECTNVPIYSVNKEDMSGR